MSIIITRGYSWGSTELVTNTKLHTLIDSATVDMSAPSAIGGTTPADGSFSTMSATGLFTLTSGQIKFPATAVPSADANTIDDYEEGTWTPTFTDSGVSFAAYATYTRIGNLCHIQAYFMFIASTAGANDIEIGGLPFTSLATSLHISGVAATRINKVNFPADTHQLSFDIEPNTKIIRPVFAKNDVTAIQGQGTDFDNAGCSLTLSGTYIVD